MRSSEHIDWARYIEPIALRLKGRPNARLSNARELRWGSHGSFSVDIDKGTWFDHETNEGGGTLDLVICLTSCRTKAEAAQWVKREFHIQDGPQPTFVAQYEYRDESGKPRYRVLRYSTEPRFRQQRWDETTGKWVGGRGCLNGVERLPFLLPQLLHHANPDDVVYICEGEKDVLNLVQHGVAASCNSGGAKNWQQEISHWFQDRDVVLLPDNDDAGREHAQDIAEKLSGISKRIRILELPGLPEKGDVSDWLDAGGTVEELHHLAEAAPVWQHRDQQLDNATSLPLVLDPGDPLTSARAFIEHHYGNSQLVCHAINFYEWQRTHYAFIDDGDIEAALWQFLASAKRTTQQHGIAPFQPTRAKVDNVMAALRALVHLPLRLTPPCWINGRNEGLLLACQNGLLRLRDEVLLPHSPDYFNTSAVAFDYDPNPPEPENWYEFLGSVWGEDFESMEALQEQFGYILSGDTRRDKMFLHVGPKRAGKGVVLRILERLLGGASHVSLTLASLTSGEFALEPLIGKMLAAVPDARLGGRHSHQLVERLLAISGGDDITINRKYKPAVTVRLPTRFWFLSNTIPKLLDTSGTIASRFIVMQYQHSFYGREDLELEGRLAAELPAILKWAISGWRALEQQGHFTQPAAGLTTMQALRALTSPVIEFIDQEYVLDPLAEVVTSDLYNDYKEWFAGTGQPGHPGNEKSFGIKLAEAFQIRRARRSEQHSGHRRFWGVYVGLRRCNRDDDAADAEGA